MEPAELILDNTNPINHEIHIEVPDGYEIDEENSTFKCIKLKPIKKPKFSDYDGSFINNGYIINTDSQVIKFNRPNYQSKKNIFATEKQAKSALAMAQISQIMTNDERFGGAITDEEWGDVFKFKSIITREINKIVFHSVVMDYHFLAFHTEAQRALFLKENEQLVKDYLMID